MRLRWIPELVASKIDEVEIKPAEHGRPGRCKGGDYKRVQEGKKKGVSHGEFNRMRWMKQQGSDEMSLEHHRSQKSWISRIQMKQEVKRK